MNIRKSILGLSIVGTLLLSHNGDAQTTRNGQTLTVNTVTTSVPFVRIAPDARAGGMGDVGIATAPDMNSIFQNASRLAFVQGDYGVAIHYTPWLRALVNDINMVTINGY